jgi:hypothetical protein
MLENLPVILSVLSPNGELVDISKLRTFYPRGNWTAIRQELQERANSGEIVYSETRQGCLVGSKK